MGRNSSRLWKKIAFFAGIASLVSFVISTLCPNYINENILQLTSSYDVYLQLTTDFKLKMKLMKAVFDIDIKISKKK